MLKLKNLFLLALVAIVSAFVFYGCVVEEGDEEDITPATYTVTVVGGTATFTDEDGITSPVTPQSIFFAGDYITLTAPVIPGATFSRWSTVPASPNSSFSNNNPSVAYTNFTIPANDVTVTAVYNYDGESFVRFSWEKELEDYTDYNIEYVLASKSDIEWWAINIWGDLDIDEEDFYPGFPGSAFGNGNPGVTATLFDKRGLIGGSPSAATPADNPNKEAWWETKAGRFTAVCSAKDEYGFFEIVADYTITVDKATADNDGLDRHFEIAFDVAKLADPDYGDPLADKDEYIRWFEGLDGTEDPFLRSIAVKWNPLKKKTSIKKLNTVKQETKSGKMEVDYYLIRRAK